MSFFLGASLGGSAVLLLAVACAAFVKTGRHPDLDPPQAPPENQHIEELKIRRGNTMWD